nr:carbohydrate ABC transporter substrate-binding protein [Actinomycetota bacterium]
MLKKSKLVVALAAVALVASTAPAAPAAGNLEIFTWWASGGEAAGLEGMTTEFTNKK